MSGSVPLLTNEKVTVRGTCHRSEPNSCRVFSKRAWACAWRDNEIYVSATLLPEQTYTADQLAAAPELHIDSTAIDMGALNGKKRLKRELVITNTGKSTLTISALQVYNPGLGVSLGKRNLKPGESDKLKITVNANTHYFKGRRRVLLISNDPAHPKVVIDITVKK